MHTPRLTVHVTSGKRCATLIKLKLNKKRGWGTLSDLLDHCTVQHSLAFECVCILSD